MPPKKDKCPICGQTKQARSKTCASCRFPDKKINKCKQCGKETTNPRFCSRSCSVSYSNTKSPKRQALNNCVTCGKPVVNRRKYCSDECNPHTFVAESTLAEVELQKGPGRYSSIRYNARKVYGESGRSLSCVVCGYDTHVEICHIKPIAEFDKDSKISEINSLDNLMPLCPNHHWEFDNNGLVIVHPTGHDPALLD